MEHYCNANEHLEHGREEIMSETEKQLSFEKEVMNNSLTDPALPRIEVKAEPTVVETQRLERRRVQSTLREDPALSDAQDLPAIDATEVKRRADLEIEPSPALYPLITTPEKVNPEKTHGKKPLPTQFNKRDKAHAHMLIERCRHLNNSLFYREMAPVRSVGFTSSIEGEGKSFLASATAQVLSQDSIEPVVLLECNWQHPTLHEYFGIPANPGLAEWLRGSCAEDEIHHQVASNLTVIPAGNGSHDAVKLLNRLYKQGLQKAFKHHQALYIVDLPPILTTGYGSLAARLPESIVVVVRAQVVPDRMVVETCSQLTASTIHGIILNQTKSHIPRWLRQLL